MEKTNKFNKWDKNHQQIVIKLFSESKGGIDKKIMRKCFSLGNPTITYIYENDIPKTFRVEQEGSEVLKLLLKEYL